MLIEKLIKCSSSESSHCACKHNKKHHKKHHQKHHQHHQKNTQKNHQHHQKNTQKNHQHHQKHHQHHQKHHQKNTQKNHKKNHQNEGHRRCARVVVDRVLADEVVTCCETTGPCDIGIAVPPCSVLQGTIQVTVLKCTPMICGPGRPIQVDIMLVIQKELVVCEPNGKKIPLEFTFFRQCRKCLPPIKLDCIDPKRVHCLVSEIKKVCAHIDFICANAAFDCHATIAEQLEVVLKLKLVVEEQLDVALCRANKDVLRIT